MATFVRGELETRAQARRRRWSGLAAAGWAGVRRGAVRARAWRVTAAVPGLAGAAGVSVGVGGIVGTFAQNTPGGWFVGALAGGVFLLRLDARL